jgi:hypothetical protein
MFENKEAELISFTEFLKRLALFLFFGIVIIGGGLLIGIAGYHHFANLGWIDSLLNASMILTGMGPVDQLTTDSAKVFASCYALFSGIVFLSAIGILFAPVAHRILHSFHISEKD